RLPHPLHVLDEPGRLTESDYEDARRQRVERATMPNLRAARQQPLNAVNQVTRRWAARLIENQQTVPGRSRRHENNSRDRDRRCITPGASAIIPEPRRRATVRL